MRLIDADALANALFEKRKNYPQWVADTIGNMPTVDADAMLKEQEVQKFFVDESGKITPLPIVFPNCPLKEYEAVVRCKDCKHYDHSMLYCNKFGIQDIDDDWFCADGERKEGR